MITYTQTHRKINDDIEWLFSRVSNEAKNRKDNYDLSSIDPDEILCYSVSYQDKTPYLVSIAWERPFYLGMVRLASKYAVNPDLAHDIPFGQGLRYEVIDHIDQQYDFCKKLGYDDFFMSREDKTKTARNTNRIYEVIREKSRYSWKLSEGKRLVCRAPQDSSCWQWVIYNNDDLLWAHFE